MLHQLCMGYKAQMHSSESKRCIVTAASSTLYWFTRFNVCAASRCALGVR